MATAQICPVVGSTTSSLPPNHPTYDVSNPSLVCPVTKATAGHHENLHNHPSTPGATINNAGACPALKNANSSKSSLTDATCPVIGPVSAYLPIGHPKPEDAEQGAVCPATGASLEHHKGKVEPHPKVAAGVCPVAHKTLEEVEGAAA